MQNEPEAALFPRFVLVLVILLVIVLLWYISRAIFVDQQLSIYEKGYIGTGISLFVIGLIYVIVQRLEMRKKEKFRREKW